MLQLHTIARLEESRQASGLAEVAPEHIAVAGGTVARAPAGTWMNNAVAVGLSCPVSDADFDQIVTYYTSAGIEPRLEVCPFADPSVLKLAGERQFVVKLFENVFYRELAPGDTITPLVPTPDGLRVERVDPKNERAVREFCETAVSGFMPPGMAPREEDLDSAARCARHPRTVSVVARLDGLCVGAGSVAIHAGPDSGQDGGHAAHPGGHGGIAGMFGTSVLPAYRRRGVQQALLAYRLGLAAQRGATLATIGSLPGIATERNVRRMGFALAYTKVILVKPGPGLAPNIS
jgi:GNAT superfamily N-acetyltransferase